jgi:hypothetical protein
MSIEENKAVAGRWLAEFWGKDFNPAIIDELAAPGIRFAYSLDAPLCGREELRALAENLRASFPDLSFRATAELIAEGDYVLGQLKGRGIQARDAVGGLPAGSLPGTGEAPQFTSTAVLKVENGMITAEIGLPAALRHLDLIIRA